MGGARWSKGLKVKVRNWIPALLRSLRRVLKKSNTIWFTFLKADADFSVEVGELESEDFEEPSKGTRAVIGVRMAVTPSGVLVVKLEESEQIWAEDREGGEEVDMASSGNSFSGYCGKEIEWCKNAGQWRDLTLRSYSVCMPMWRIRQRERSLWSQSERGSVETPLRSTRESKRLAI